MDRLLAKLGPVWRQVPDWCLAWLIVNLGPAATRPRTLRSRPNWTVCSFSISDVCIAGGGLPRPASSSCCPRRAPQGGQARVVWSSALVQGQERRQDRCGEPLHHERHVRFVYACTVR